MTFILVSSAQILSVVLLFLDISSVDIQICESGGGKLIVPSFSPLDLLDLERSMSISCCESSSFTAAFDGIVFSVASNPSCVLLTLGEIVAPSIVSFVLVSSVLLSESFLLSPDRQSISSSG